MRKTVKELCDTYQNPFGWCARKILGWWISFNLRWACISEINIFSFSHVQIKIYSLNQKTETSFWWWNNLRNRWSKMKETWRTEEWYNLFRQRKDIQNNSQQFDNYKVKQKQKKIGKLILWSSTREILKVGTMSSSVSGFIQWI